MIFLIGPRHSSGAHNSDCATGVARSDEGVFFSWDRMGGFVDSGPKTLVASASNRSTPEWTLVDSRQGRATKSNFALSQPGQCAFEDPGGGGGIDPLRALGAAHVVVVDHAARDGGGAEPLVLEQYRQCGERRRAMAFEIGRELAHRLAARTLGTVHVERQADHQRLGLMLARELGQGGEVGREL